MRCFSTCALALSSALLCATVSHAQTAGQAAPPPVPDAMPFDNIIGKHFDLGDYPTCIRHAIEAIDVNGVRARQKRGERDGRLIGVGFAFFNEQGAVGTSVSTTLWEARAALQDALAEAAGLRTSLQASRDEADALRASLGRLEGEMEGLSSAYSSLDSHAAELQAELVRLRKREQHGAASEGGDQSEGLGAAPPPEDDELTDLLVCLGQEEAKVRMWMPGGGWVSVARVTALFDAAAVLGLAQRCMASWPAGALAP